MTKAKPIKTPIQRKKLKPQREPYWKKLDHPKGTALGVRVGERLTWIARAHHAGKYKHKSLGAVVDGKFDFSQVRNSLRYAS